MNACIVTRSFLGPPLYVRTSTLTPERSLTFVIIKAVTALLVSEAICADIWKRINLLFIKLNSNKQLNFIRHLSSDDQFFNFNKRNQEYDSNDRHYPRFPANIGEFQPSGNARSVDAENHKGKSNDKCANHPSIACDSSFEHGLMYTSCIKRVD